MENRNCGSFDHNWLLRDWSFFSVTKRGIILGGFHDGRKGEKKEKKANYRLRLWVPSYINHHTRVRKYHGFFCERSMGHYDERNTIPLHHSSASLDPDRVGRYDDYLPYPILYIQKIQQNHINYLSWTAGCSIDTWNWKSGKGLSLIHI